VLHLLRWYQYQAFVLIAITIFVAPTFRSAYPRPADHPTPTQGTTGKLLNLFPRFQRLEYARSTLSSTADILMRNAATQAEAAATAAGGKAGPSPIKVMAGRTWATAGGRGGAGPFHLACVVLLQ
jgi:hypothetical protein